jgi:hypothetical protein
MPILVLVDFRNVSEGKDNSEQFENFFFKCDNRLQFGFDGNYDQQTCRCKQYSIVLATLWTGRIGGRLLLQFCRRLRVLSGEQLFVSTLFEVQDIARKVRRLQPHDMPQVHGGNLLHLRKAFSNHDILGRLYRIPTKLEVGMFENLAPKLY